MRILSEKLHSARGSSFLIALMFFLICLVIGALILTTATANMIKTKDRYSEQQTYLAVASAARLVKNELGSYTYTTGKQVTADSWKSITPYITPDDAMNGDLLTDAYAITGGQTAYTQSFTISAGEDVPSVSAELSMRTGGNATIVLTAGDYTMKVFFAAHTARIIDDMSYDYKTTSWDTGVITKGVT